MNGLALLEPDLAFKQYVEDAFRRRFRPDERRMAKRLDSIDGAGDAERLDPAGFSEKTMCSGLIPSVISGAGARASAC